MFPPDINFKWPLHIDKPIPAERILHFLQEEMKKVNVEDISVKGNHISFKNGFLNYAGKWHIMASVSSGYFDLDDTAKTLTYSISTLRTLIFASVICLGFAIITKATLYAAAAFVWLYGANCVIAYVRHKRFFEELVATIESKY